MADDQLLYVELFGGLRVRLCGREITHFESRKAAALLAYLALFPKRSHPRELLAEMLWPDEESDATRDRLRQAMSSLRRQLDAEGVQYGGVLIADRSDVALDAGMFATDVAEFESAVKEADRAQDLDTRSMELARAVELYTGELLPGYYEDFFDAERGRLAAAFRDALSAAAETAAANGNLPAAIDYGRRAVSEDPLREDAHCSLMRHYAAAGRISDSIRQYQELERALRQELALTPSSAAQSLLEELRTCAPAPLAGKSCANVAGAKQLQVTLEAEGGAVPLESLFYVLRPTDAEFDAAVLRRDSIVLVKGARQMGKTSLLARGLQCARTGGAFTVFTDLQKLTAQQLESADALFRSFAEAITDQLNLDLPPAALWNDDRGWNVNFERFVRREVLERFDGHVVWALDEVDRLFGFPFCAETFGLFRSWHNERALNPDAPWGRLTLAMAYSTEAHLFISDLNQSPFNVGTRLTLADLTQGEAAELNRRYGSPLRDTKETTRYFGLVGGQPYLVRRGLHAMSADGLDIDAFMEFSDRDDGPYGDHLRRLYSAFRDDASLTDALRAVLAGMPCPTQESFYRLRSAGILTGKSVEGGKLRCRLYQDYFERRLS